MTAGRVEARMTVPAGGAAVSASNGAHASPLTVTVPAANYYMNAAGGVAGLLATFQQYLNDNVQGYPLTAAAMQALVGYGTWSAGWAINETAGNLAAAFGAPSLTANGSPTYVTGPRSGIDKAVGFDTASGANYFSGGDVHDADATSDLLIAIVFKVSTVAAGGADIIGKGYGGGLPGYLVVRETAELAFYVHDGVDEVRVAASGLVADTWYVGICALDRTSNQSRVGFAPLGGAATVSAATSTAAVGTIVNALNFKLGNNNVYNANPGNLYASALYVGTGVGAAGSIVTNLSTAVGNFANAVNAAWSCTLGSDGRVTIANSYLPSSVAFTNTTLRNLLGFEYDFDYPQTAAQMAAALGYGTWSAGWQFNITSGNDTGSFGGVTLTAAGTPLYSLPGPRGGLDLAVGFDANPDFFGAGDNFDPLNVDYALAAVVKFSSLANCDIVAKGWSTSGFLLCLEDVAGVKNISIYTTDGVDTVVARAANVPVDTWLAVVCVLDRSGQVSRIGYAPISTGVSVISSTSDITAVGNMDSAGGFFVGGAPNFGQSGGLQIAALYVATGASSATGLSANLSTALANFATYMRSQTGTQQARGLFYPDCFLDMVGDPKRAPTVSDLRQSMSPTGQVLGIVGNTFRRHRSVGWSHVPAAQVWDAEATYENASWEEFFIETQMGLGSSWFTPSSPIQIYDHNNVQVGVDANVAGWYIVGLVSVEPNKSAAPWCGQWRIEIPQLIAVGS